MSDFAEVQEWDFPGWGTAERIEDLYQPSVRVHRLVVLCHIQRINRFKVVYFTKEDDLAALNRAAAYVLANELTYRLQIVHCYEREQNCAGFGRNRSPSSIRRVGVHGRFGTK